MKDAIYSLFNVKFVGANFTNADLNNIVGERLIFGVSDFTNVEMNNFEFSDIWFLEVLFDNAEIKNGEFNHLTGVNVSFKNTDLDGTLFKESEFSGSVNMDCKNNINCNKCDISICSKISEVTINKCFKKIESLNI
mgnify:CR=1 FL=1